jgi:hypothetical protein
MLDNWPERFPGCEPIGYRLRELFPNRWVRFHSLPESKRYPENENEYEMILHRHNCILGELVGTGWSVVLLTTGYSDAQQPVRTYPELDALDPDAKPWRSVAMHSANREFTDPSYWHVFASAREWQPGLFDPLIRLVADDTVANVMIVHPDCRWLLHPYDGGMDVIAESPAARGLLWAAHKEWLSSRADGL